MEDDAESALGIRPRDSTLAIAHHVTGAAFETIFVIEQDAAVTGGNEKVGRTGNDTFARRTAATGIAVDGDMGAFMNAEFSSTDSFFEGNSLPR